MQVEKAILIDFNLLNHWFSKRACKLVEGAQYSTV